MYETILKGGYTMIPLSLCSLISIAVIVEKGWVLREKKVLPEKLLRRLREHPENPQIEADGSPLGAVIETVRRTRPWGRQRGSEALQLTLKQVGSALERGLSLLEITAVVSPLLGLLGTVLGMVEVFKVISRLGVGQAQAMSSGISQALITTIAGLIVAIPALVAHGIYTRKVDSLLLELESVAEACLGNEPAAREKT
jgi:biopolymer transport protein ExbB